MKHRWFSALAVLACAVLVPQLLYFWFAPFSRAAWLVVYLAGTALTAAPPAAAFVCLRRSGVRRGMCAVLAAAAAELGAIALCAALLAFNASVRTAFFALAIAALVCAACVVPAVLWAALPEQGVRIVPQSPRGEDGCAGSDAPQTKTADVRPARSPLPPRTH